MLTASGDKVAVSFVKYDGSDKPKKSPTLWEQFKALLSTPSGWILFWLNVILFVCGNYLLLVKLFKFGHNPDQVVEFNTQLLTAVITLITISNHPLLMYDLVSLLRGKPEGLLRTRYPWYRSRELQFKHLFSVLFFLNLNCFGQYGMTTSMWAFGPEDRPDIFLYTALPIAVIGVIVGQALNFRFKKLFSNPPLLSTNEEDR